MEIPTEHTVAINTAQHKLLYLIKTSGALGANEVSVQLRMTSMGARQHMQDLEDKGYLLHEFIQSARGRPKKQWQLTAKGQGIFPDGHSALLVNLLDHMQQKSDKNELDELIKSRENEMLDSYLTQLNGLTELTDRARKLAEIRSNEGYMAEIVEQEEHLFLVENHCPICAAATQCQQLCRSELSIFQQVLGCQVERTEYILSGARRCAYRILQFADVAT